MKVALLDVNVLVALFDPAHPDHEEPHAWFGRHGKRGWATCPVTINGCVRVLSSPAYRTVEATPAEVVARLRIFCSQRGHRFPLKAVIGASAEHLAFQGAPAT